MTADAWGQARGCVGEVTAAQLRAWVTFALLGGRQPLPTAAAGGRLAPFVPPPEVQLAMLEDVLPVLAAAAAAAGGAGGEQQGGAAECVSRLQRQYHHLRAWQALQAQADTLASLDAATQGQSGGHGDQALSPAVVAAVGAEAARAAEAAAPGSGSSGGAGPEAGGDGDAGRALAHSLRGLLEGGCAAGLVVAAAAAAMAPGPVGKGPDSAASPTPSTPSTPGSEVLAGVALPMASGWDATTAPEHAGTAAAAGAGPAVLAVVLDALSHCLAPLSQVEEQAGVGSTCQEAQLALQRLHGIMTGLGATYEPLAVAAGSVGSVESVVSTLRGAAWKALGSWVEGLPGEAYGRPVVVQVLELQAALAAGQVRVGEAGVNNRGGN